MSLDIHPERTRVLPERKPRLIIPVIIWFGLIVGVGMLLVGLSGCAPAATFTGICALQPVGVTDGGVAVARVHCEAQ